MATKIIIIISAILFLSCFMSVNRYHISPHLGGGVYRFDRWTGNIDLISNEQIMFWRRQEPPSARKFLGIPKEEERG